MKSFRACFCLYRIFSKNCRAKKTAATGECVDFRTGFHSAVPRAFGAKPQKFDCAQNDPFGVRADVAKTQTAATPHLPRKHHAPARVILSEREQVELRAKRRSGGVEVVTVSRARRERR